MADAAAARWTDTAASKFTDHQPHDSTMGEQGGASTPDVHTSVNWDNVVGATTRKTSSITRNLTPGP